MIPPKGSAAFVAHMEDVLKTYANPYDSALPSSPAKQDCSYQRQGMANLFKAFESLMGRRHVEVTTCKTSFDFAHFMKQLADEDYFEAQKIVLVCDNLGKHSLAASYQAFGRTKARRLARRFQRHNTP